MFVEMITAGIVAAALLWLVVQPMVSPVAASAVDLDPPDPEETPRGQALLALKEIEFDRATGKLSEADYQLLNAKYSAAAIAALEAPQANFCSQCGAALPPGAVYCAQCGQKTIDDRR